MTKQIKTVNTGEWIPFEGEGFVATSMCGKCGRIFGPSHLCGDDLIMSELQKQTALLEEISSDIIVLVTDTIVKYKN